MATADVPTECLSLEGDEDAMRQREILSSCFSEIRQQLDDRETQLSLQLEQNLRDNKKGKKRKGEERRVQFEWSPQQLYSEINKIGEVSLLPASPRDDSDSNNCKRTKLESVGESPFDVQKQEIQSLLSQILVRDEVWYLIEIRWYRQWKRYVGYDDWDTSDAGNEAKKPAAIDNTSLLDNGKLKRHKTEDIDFKIVPAPAWDRFMSWYGITGESEIKRKVIEYGKSVKQFRVEIYPLEVKVCVYPEEKEFDIILLSRCDTILTLDRKIREFSNIDADKKTRIYVQYKANAYELIKDMSKESQFIGLMDGQGVLLEIRNPDGDWPRTAVKRDPK